MESPELVHLTVGEVRQRIFQASANAAAGEGSAAGQLFHRTVEYALRPGHPAFWRVSLAGDRNPERWAYALYELALGPELTRLQAALREHGAAVLAVWKATNSFCGWFCGLVGEAVAAGALHYDALQERWCGAEALFTTELELTAVLREPGWRQAVALSGRADHLLQVAADRWCVVEFKLGGGHPEADAAQACLYHELMGGKGSAALLHFTGEGEPGQVVFTPAMIQQARPPLMALIGAMAGVTRSATPEPAKWPKEAGAQDLELGGQLIRALHEFGADAKLAGPPLVGPTFVRYPLEPGRGVTAAKIERQGGNLQLRLQLDSEPMMSRAGGRLVVDIQRPEREFVPFHELMPSLQAAEGSRSRVLAGIDLFGKVHFVDLAGDAPHLLVGGTPGSGKSEWLRCAVASLMLANTEQALKLVLIDPKKNAFSDLIGSPYLWRPDALIDNPEGAVIPLLENLVAEIGRRNQLLQQARADDLAQYCRKTGTVLPRLVCVVDEFADLLMGARKAERDEVESGFVRIAQIGRAAGVHLILATQRPSRQVVSGLLKANIPTRVALRVSNRVDSGVLLDQSGAQYLLGKGDLLLSSAGRDPVRLQSAWLSDEDRRSLFAGQRSALEAVSR